MLLYPHALLPFINLNEIKLNIKTIKELINYLDKYLLSLDVSICIFI